MADEPEYVKLYVTETRGWLVDVRLDGPNGLRAHVEGRNDVEIVEAVARDANTTESVAQAIRAQLTDAQLDDIDLDVDADGFYVTRLEVLKVEL